jgi:hypothetical protein
MLEPKNKREENGVEMETDDSGIVLEPTQIELGSGYAVSVRYDENDKPIVDVKTYGKVDVAKMLKDIGRVYPHAQIHHLNQPSSVTIAKKHQKKKRRK